MAKSVREALTAAVDEGEDEPVDRLQGYLDAIAKYDKEFAKWSKRVDKIIKRYRDEERASADRLAKFNILWSNVQTLVPATFARLPQPDVSRRFRDQDPKGRVGALLLERGLEFEVQHYPDYRDTMTQCVHDRFLGGRGTAWIRYEPHFKAAERPDDALQITEDVADAEPEEQLDYECAPVDYVHWKDFGHSVARTWEEVTLVWRKVYMSEEAVKERFPEDQFPDLYVAGKLKIPFDATPEEANKSRGDSQVAKQALIYELWDKEEGEACWFSKSMHELLDTKPDPLKLQQFFPCPKPLYATLTNDTLVPVPDFTLYQDQANTLDTLADRAAGLVDMLQLKGTYDASDASGNSALARLFTEGTNGTLLPVKNWAAYAEKGGLKGQVDVLDLSPIAKALEAVYLAAEQQKNQVYEIMGISDIVRGSSDPNETLGAQELKGQYASMRLRAMQADVARFATDILQLKAQVMCGKFNPQTLLAIAAAEQLSEIDKQAAYQMQPGPVDPATGQPTPPQPVIGADGKPMPGPAVELLVGPERMQDPTSDAPNPLRSFRIEVNADSMIQMNEAKDKQDRLEFLTSIGTFIEKSAPVVQMSPGAGPLIMEMLKFGVTAFKVGKTVEGKFDELIDKMMQAAMQPKPPPPPDPKVEAEKARAQADMQIAQTDVQVAQAKAQIDVQKMQQEQQIDQQQLVIDQQAAQQQMAMQGQKHAMTMAQQQEAGRLKDAQMAAAHQQKMRQAQAPARKQ